jgi:hypothetical protein
VLLEAKAAALHPERYQSSLSKLSIKREGEAGEKRRQSDWLANQMDRKVMDRQVEDRKCQKGEMLNCLTFYLDERCTHSYTL